VVRNAIATALIAACIVFFVPVPVQASCEPGASPTYDDVTGIAVRSCGNEFSYEGWTLSNGFVYFSGKYGAPVKGYYDGKDGKPLFTQLLNALRAEDFVAIRLKPSPTPYFGGPCETIEIMRCGVATAVGTKGGGLLPFLPILKDPQIIRFEELFDKLQTSIFAWPWQKEHLEVKPTPNPTLK
jgi:hypothetical protein